MARARTTHGVAWLLSLLVVPASGLSAGQIGNGAVRGKDHSSLGAAGVSNSTRVQDAPAQVTNPLENGATLSDNMGGAYKFQMRLLNDDVEAWSLGSTAVLHRVPEELKNGTLFAGTRDLVWNGQLTLNAKFAGYAYLFVSPDADGGVTKLFHEQVGSMSWKGTDTGELVIYRIPMRANSWIDITIDSKFNGGIVFKPDQSAEEKATNSQVDYMYWGCRESLKLVNSVEKDDPLTMTVQRCFLFCQAHKGTVFFGVERGRKCWCAPIFHGSELEKKRCDTPCDGNQYQMCGGDGGAASVHVMFHCGKGRPDAEPNIEYHVAEGQTCGQQMGQAPMLAQSGHVTQRHMPQFLQKSGSKQSLQGPRPPSDDEPGGYRISVEGSETLVGSPDDCIKACTSSHECGAFTYDKYMMKCTFLVAGDEDWADVQDNFDCFSKIFSDQNRQGQQK